MIDIVGVLVSRITAARAAFLDAALSSRAPAATALSTADYTAGRAANLDAAVSGRLATVINSIQTGVITIASGGVSNTATITSVNTAKAQVIFDGEASAENVVGSAYIGGVELTNATTVTATRSGAPNRTDDVGFTVVEYK